jgi:nicotinamidase-related amidase
MAVDVAALLDPQHTAVVTMELQRGVIGDSAVIAPLAEEVAARGVVATAARVLVAARRVGARVVHCTAEFRADRAGSRSNAPLLRALAKAAPHPLTGSDAAQVVPQLGPEPGDLVSSRTHGLTPFPGTELDQILRNLDVRTIVAMGVSLNVGVSGLVMVGVDLGYDVVVVTDAVAGIPREYGDAVLEHTIAPLATRLTADEVVETWARLQRS